MNSIVAKPQTSGETEHLPAYYGLPSTVQFCRRCVVSNQRPSSVVEFRSKPGDPKPTIEFDAEGICSACRFMEKKENEIDWDARERELVMLCGRYRSRNGSHDCIVPGSGGKDSVYVAHVLKNKYGMNPLTITWAPHKYTETGWRNFQAWIGAGLDNILFSPNSQVHSKLARLAFLNLCHPFQPFVVGQRMSGPRASVLFDIPLVFYGENQAEYGNDIAENDRPTMRPEFFSQKPDLESLVLAGHPASQLIAEHGFSARDLNFYLPVTPERLKSVETTVHYLSYYLKWDPQKNFYYAVENTSFETFPERIEGSYSKYASFDDVIDWLHWYTTFIKFGIGRATYDAAQEIRTAKITREEGVALVHRYDGEPPRRYFQDILNYLAIDEDLYWKIIDQARSPHLWKKVDNDWVLRHRVS